MEICYWFTLKDFKQKPILDKTFISNYFKTNNAECLGCGGFGETWAISKNGNIKAVKIILNANYPRKRLEREIEGLVRASSPYIVKLLSKSELNYNDQNLPFLVFDYIPGGNLMSHLCNGRWPKTTEVNDLLLGLLKGLNELHIKEVIHRDIKPENIILKNGNFHEPVIVDLGLAKILDLPPYTIYPNRMGTAPYMAPEQIRGDEAKKGTDLWAVGIILYLLLERKHPFYDEKKLSQEEALDRLLSREIEFHSTSSLKLKNLINKFLSPEPYQRGRAYKAMYELEV